MKKKLIVWGVVIIALLVGGYGAYRTGINFVFDRYFMKTALSSVSNIEENGLEGDPGENAGETGNIPSLKSEETEEPSENVFQQQKKQNEEKTKKRLSNTEIITRVLKSPELTYKMSSMIPYEEKSYVLRIVMSNFTMDELTEIAKTVSKGMTPEYKSKMIAEARFRLSASQWNECLSVAYKYIEKIRPYVE